MGGTFLPGAPSRARGERFAKVATDTIRTTTRSFSFTPHPAGTYRFYTRAKDKAGNYEAPPGVADASTAYRP
jgi:hypothetical protein